MLKVRDIMQSEVVSASPGMSVRQFTRLLADAEISGCPVTDSQGQLLGVVSATDVVRMAADEADLHIAVRAPARSLDGIEDPDLDEDPGPDPFGFFLPEDASFMGPELLSEFAEEEIEESEFDSATVADIMTSVTYSVKPDDDVRSLAEFLVRERIHRALVVEDGELLGIVTSSDVLRAVADGRLT